MKRVASLYLPDWSIDRLRRNERRHAPPAETDGRAAFDRIGAAAAAERAVQCSVPKEGGWRPGARWARAAGPDDAARSARAEVTADIAALPSHQQPPQRELGRASQAADNPFRLREMARRTEAAGHPFQRSGRGEDVEAAIAALPGHQRPSFQERSRRSEVVENPFRPLASDDGGTSARRLSSPRRSDRDGHGGEAGFIAPPNLARLAIMPSVQFPGEGPHPDNHGKSAPTAPSYGQGRFFQTGRTLGPMVARICTLDEAGPRDARAEEPPLVTTHKLGTRAEIAAVNAAARGLGLHPGMALTMARAQVPGLAVRDADPQGDAAELAALADLLARRWAPTVMVCGTDGLFIDLTGVAHLHGGEMRFARRIVRLLARHGIGARVAVADTAGAAWALARCGDDAIAIVPGGTQTGAIAPLPVAALRLEASALELLARLGIATIGQLLAMPRAPLVQRFGQAIVTRIDQAIGRAPEPFEPVTPREPIAVEQRFAEPIATPEAIEHWLGQLMPRLGLALAQAGQGARLVELVAARVDGLPQSLRLGFARPTRDPFHMLRLALRRIEEIEPGYGLDALALHVRRADTLGPESLAPALADAAAPDLAPLVDALINRIGSARLWRAIPVESDVPERSFGRRGPLDPPEERRLALKPDDVRRLDVRALDHPWHPRWPRPIRMLRRPELLDHVLAELPDQPPRRFTWRGITHLVVRADGPERIAGEWWRRPAEGQAVRDYFRVEDEHGQRFWLYRRGDGLRGVTGDLTWYLHGRSG